MAAGVSRGGRICKRAPVVVHYPCVYLQTTTLPPPILIYT